MNRKIVVSVRGEYAEASGHIAGASGSHNAVDLEFIFDSAWDGTTKKVYFFDARGENPVCRILLVTDVNEAGNHQISIPSEPLVYPGEMVMTVMGVILDGESAERVIVSASVHFTVLEAYLPSADTEPADVTPTQAEQIQGQIDTILAAAGMIANAEQYEANAQAAAAEAAGYASAAISAKDTAFIAQGQAENAATSAQTAEANATTAKTQAETAKSAAETAQAAAETAQGAAETAAATATTKAREASESAAAAAASATSIVGDVAAANSAASSAESSASLAATSADSASDSATLSESWAVGNTGKREGENTNNAKYWAEQAQAAAGGGVLSFNGRTGFVSPTSGDYTPEMVGAVNKSGDTMTGQLTVPAFFIEAEGGNEGGQMQLEKPESNTDLQANVTIDLLNNLFRIFEHGGTFRGVTLDLSQCAADIASKLWHSGNDGAGSGLDADLLDGKHAADFALQSFMNRFSNIYGACLPYTGDLNDVDYNSILNFDFGGGATNTPWEGWGFLLTMVHAATAAWRLQVAFPMTGMDAIAYRFCADGTWTGWTFLYTEARKPSAADVTAGTFPGMVQANATAQSNLTYQIRNIGAGDFDPTAGVTPLADGLVYLVYE